MPILIIKSITIYRDKLIFGAYSATADSEYSLTSISFKINNSFKNIFTFALVKKLTKF
jgi:hypothetical protein